MTPDPPQRYDDPPPRSMSDLLSSLLTAGDADGRHGRSGGEQHDGGVVTGTHQCARVAELEPSQDDLTPLRSLASPVAAQGLG